MFNVQCFFYAYFKITIGRIDHFETITWVVVFTGCAWWQVFFDRRRWSAMFLYSCDQMSDSFANIGRICITQTCKLIYDIGLQGHRGMALQGKIIFHFHFIKTYNMKILQVAFLLLFNYLDSLPKLYNEICMYVGLLWRVLVLRSTKTRNWTTYLLQSTS